MNGNRLELPTPGNGFFLSSSGGHFSELIYIARKFKASADSVILTFNGSDTKAATLEFRIYYIKYVEPRKFLPLLRLMPSILRSMKNHEFNYIASTGAAIAIIGYLLSKIKRLPFYYVEIVARQTTLSLTAKILKLLGVGQIFVQSPFLKSAYNTYLEHPLSEYEVIRSKASHVHGAIRILVAFGTIQGFNFNRGLDLVKSITNENDSIEWQVGFMNAGNLPGIKHERIDRADFLESIAKADVVICHGGIGVITDCLRSGKTPLVIPRRKSFGEHVDDHQVEIVNFLSKKGLVINLEVEHGRNVIHDVLTNQVIHQKDDIN